MNETGLSKNKVLIFDSLDQVVSEYGQVQLSTDQLRDLGLSHILVRGSGYMKFSLILTRKKMYELLEKDFTSIIEEKLPGLRGVYGYYGVSTGLIGAYKEIKEAGEEEKLFTVIVEYEGPSLLVNSGALSGMVIINGNYSNINLKSMIK